MATRGRHGRDEGPKEFTGRVRRWTRTWVASKEPKSKELRFSRWMQTGAWGEGGEEADGSCVSPAAASRLSPPGSNHPTGCCLRADERPPELAGPRHSYIVPVSGRAAVCAVCWVPCAGPCSHIAMFSSCCRLAASPSNMPLPACLQRPTHPPLQTKDDKWEPYPKHRIMPQQPAGGPLPQSAAVGAPGMKRGKSQVRGRAGVCWPCRHAGPSCAVPPVPWQERAMLCSLISCCCRQR